MAEYNFQKELKNSIFNADPALDRHELLIDIFKAYVAKLFEMVLAKKGKDRLEVDAMVVVKRNLIDEFRKTDLAEYQRPVDWYEDLFEKTIKEIFNEAAHAHPGMESISVQQQLEINRGAYIKEGGLFVPNHLAG
jgi:hypothetical protein